ncbi:MAG: UDP-N-acetylmuramoyl-L-alanyl-D-glutamate--2,6-diaminopimelate ligase [Planctomycetota bacterium]
MIHALDSAVFRRLMKTSVNTLPLSTLVSALREALPDLERHGPDPSIRGLCGDSRQVQPGDLFVASSGSKDDGRRHVGAALAAGAVAVLCDRPPEQAEALASVAWLSCADVVRARALVADEFYGHPSQRLDVVGITGTNGKTTSSFLLRSMLAMDGRRCGLIGTLGAWRGEHHVPLANTTPDALALHKLLAEMVDENHAAAVLEVSSHALVQQRALGIAFDVGVFTNLTPDHLDYHGTMEAYGAAKGKLFESLSPQATAVLNAQDPASRLYRLSTAARVLQFAVQGGPQRRSSVDAQVDVHAEILRLDAEGTRFRLRAPEFALDADVGFRLVGRHNVENALAATTAALALGLPAGAITTGLESLPAVPGRLEPVTCGQDFRVLVDYAHTPDALEKVLELLRPLCLGRLLVVFGCGGDRDRSKRPLMGRAVAAAADRLYVTSDNPRSEEPQAILDEIMAGIPAQRGADTRRLVDRREAIALACAEAQGGDIVLIAGKGHETTQTIGERVLPFDDRAVAREVLWSL